MDNLLSSLKKTQSKDRQPAELSWARWGNIIGNWLPYSTLAVALVLAWLQRGQTWQHLVETTLLAALAAAWVYFLYTRLPERRSQPARVALYYAGFLALAAALMSRQPIFFLFAATGFFHASDLRPWPLVFLGVGLTSILINTLVTGFPWPERETWIFFGALIGLQTLAIGFGNLLAEKLAHLSEQRRAAVARLEAALEENAGLQAQLVTQAREAGILEERQRLAREIHDTLAQGLIGIITQLGALQQASDNPESRQRHLEGALLLARESLAEARRSVHALSPGPLVSARLPDALAEVAQKWSEGNGVKTQVTVTGNPVDLDPQIQHALLRTAQEALMNVAKHAQASRVGITLSYLGNEVALDIRDDGAGFSVEAAQVAGGSGFGLTAMRQRIDRLAGRLEIESEPGEGTAVSARVPINQAREEEVVR
jgi:signal transduction histidine kinase